MNNQDGPSDWAAKDITIPLLLSGVLAAVVCIALCAIVYPSRDFITNKMAVNPGRTESSALLLPCPAIPAGWEMIINDDFDGSQDNWPVGSDVGAYAAWDLQVVDDLLRFRLKAYQGVFYDHTPYTNNAPKNFYVSTQARKVSGPYDAEYGITFRTYGSQVLFYGIQDSGRLRVHVRDVESEWQDALFTAYSEHVKVREYNELAILAQDGHYTFCVNQHFEGEVDTADYPFGKLGLAIELENSGDEAQIEFDDFVVYAPAK